MTHLSSPVCIVVGGFAPTAKIPDLKKWFPLEETVCRGLSSVCSLLGADLDLTIQPTLHVIGKNDAIISEERSLELAELCWDSRIERHDGGHFVPSKGSFRNFFKSYISSFAPGGLMGDVPQPNSSTETASSTPRDRTPEAML